MPVPTASSPKARPASSFLLIPLWLMVLVGVFAGFRSATHRYHVEKENRRVEIALDYAELRTLATAEGLPLTDVMEQFKAAGVTSVTVQEETVAGLEETRRFTVTSDTTPETVIHAKAGEEALLKRIEAALQKKTHFQETLTTRGDTALLTIKEPWSGIRAVGVGLDEDTVNTVRGAGLGIVGRVSNWTGVTPEGLEWTLGELKKQGVSTVLFSGDEILGFKGYISNDPKEERPSTTTSSTLKNLGLYYGAIEFGKQKGDPELAKAVAENTVRVHTILGSEMATMTPPEAVQRFALAARERNMRLLFVRLFTDEPNPIAFNTNYIKKIVHSLDRGGLKTGAAHGYPDLVTKPIYRLLIGLGVGAAFVLVLHYITGALSGGLGIWGPILALVGLVGITGVAAAPIAIGAKVVALLAAILFPTLALVMNDLLSIRFPFGAVVQFLFTCLVTAMGMVCVVGLLADRLFLIKADAFAGIKAALFLPVLVVALVYALDLRAREGRTFRKAVDEAVERIVLISSQPILIWQIGAGLVALILIVLLLARSGNDSGVGVSGIEMKVRSLLDRFLYARPRFKDMFGHAALVFSLLLFHNKGRRDWALPFFLVGVIGQVSFLNTFCHLHTPLPVSMWRAGIGLGVGLFSGVIAYYLADRLILRHLPEPAPSAPEVTP